MGSKYEWGINPFQDFLFDSVENGVDISDVNMEVDLYVGFSTILKYYKNNETYEKFLDYEIKKDDICFKVVAKNVLTALWLSGILPQNPEDVINNNKFVIGDREYKFNKKTKRLTYKLIDKK